MPGTTQGSTSGQIHLGQFLAVAAGGEVTHHPDLPISQGSTDGFVHLGQFNIIQAGALGFHPDAKYHWGSAVGFVHLPPEEGGDTIIVTTWEDDLVAQFVSAEIPTTRTIMFTTPSDRNAIIRWMDLVNMTSSPTVVDVWLDNVKWEHERSVPGNEIYSRNTIAEIGPDTTIEAQASMAEMNLFMSGVLEIHVP